MVKQEQYSIVWDGKAFEHFKEILLFLSKQSSQAPAIVKKGILSCLEDIANNPLIFEIDKLKANPNKEFRAFVIFSYRITYQIKIEKKEIRVIRIRHTSREPLGY